MTGTQGRIEPPERKETARRRILAVLSDAPLSAKQISASTGIPEKEVYGHLPHLARTVSTRGGRLAATPAECRHCGFVFRKRRRATPPSRCPVCRGESIAEARFSLMKFPRA